MFKKKKKLFLYLLFILVMVIGSTTCVYASTADLGIFGNSIFESIKTIYGNDLISNIKNSITLSGGAKFDSMWAIVNSIFNSAILPIAYALLVLYFLISILEDATRDMLTMEHFLKACIKLIIGYVLMTNALYLLTAMISFADGIMNSLIAATGSGGASSVNESALYQDIKKIYEEDTTFGINGQFIGAYLSLIVPNLCALLIKIVAIVVCFSRSIEIVVRGIFAPIAMADVFSEGTRGTGFRYLRKFMAVALQGAVIIGIAYAISIISTATSGSQISTLAQAMEASWIETIALQFAGIALMLKSLSIANDIMGV